MSRLVTLMPDHAENLAHPWHHNVSIFVPHVCHFAALSPCRLFKTNLGGLVPLATVVIPYHICKSRSGMNGIQKDASEKQRPVIISGSWQSLCCLKIEKSIMAAEGLSLFIA